MRAVLFPGQGSQYVGMGLDFYNKFDSVKKNFELADKWVKYNESILGSVGIELRLFFTQKAEKSLKSPW